MKLKDIISKLEDSYRFIDILCKDITKEMNKTGDITAFSNKLQRVKSWSNDFSKMKSELKAGMFGSKQDYNNVITSLSNIIRDFNSIIIPVDGENILKSQKILSLSELKFNYCLTLLRKANALGERESVNNNGFRLSLRDQLEKIKDKLNETDESKITNDDIKSANIISDSKVLKKSIEFNEEHEESFIDYTSIIAVKWVMDNFAKAILAKHGITVDKVFGTSLMLSNVPVLCIANHNDKEKVSKFKFEEMLKERDMKNYDMVGPITRRYKYDCLPVIPENLVSKENFNMFRWDFNTEEK